MEVEDVYVGLGGNIGDTLSIIKNALQQISSLPGVYHLERSKFYLTTPVGQQPQDNYINAVCRFQTTLEPEVLITELQSIESSLGKVPKDKHVPRVIDLDILFYGQYYINKPGLHIPHSHWNERLFVLIPLSDLVEELTVPNVKTGKLEKIDLKRYLKSFTNPNKETVILIQE